MVIYRLFISLLFTLTLFHFNTNFVSAAVDDIHSFDSQIVAHGDGSLSIKETIVYDFATQQRHGIFRNIPLVSKVGELYREIEIKINAVLRDSQPEPYTTSTSSNGLALKIGRPNETTSGEHTYTIDYQVYNAVGSNFLDHDEIYWNVTGVSWPGRIEKATASVTTDFEVKSNGQKCFTGSFGSTEMACTISEIESTSVRLLNPGEGFSVVYSYPAGTFPKSTLSKTEPGSPSSYLANKPLVFTLAILYLLLNTLLPFKLWQRYQKRKNKVSYGPPVVNFDFPAGIDKQRLTPLEVGIMDTSKLERDDVIGTIYDLAIRKYIKIINNKKDINLLGLDIGDQEELVITKLKDYQDLSQFEITLLDRLFESGDIVSVSGLKKDFYKTFQTIEKDSFAILVKRGFYSENPKLQKGVYLAFGLLALFTANLMLGLVLIYIGLKITGRTPAGDLADWQIDGLKPFLKGRAREYSWNAKNLHVVEKMIPYAVSLGLINEFMKQFQFYYPDYQPNWYTGKAAFYSSFTGIGNSFNTNFTTTASSASSGMGGGGFSGGGGGGGGGGSW